MIKLIASDLDGTLLQGSAQRPSPEAMELIRALQQKGVLFAAASGRQCPNLHRIFWPLSQEMVLLGENGCLVTYKGRTLFQKELEREAALELIREILAMGEDCEVLVSAPQTYWLLPKTLRYLDMALNRWDMTLCTTRDPEDICDPILKISLCMADGLNPQVVEDLCQRWQGRFKTAVSGREWLDFTTGHKGLGIQAVREAFGFSKEEIAVFGDNYNDVEMLEEAGLAFVMDTAPDPGKARGNRICHRVEDSLGEILREMT